VSRWFADLVGKRPVVLSKLASVRFVGESCEEDGPFGGFIDS
jgi:hypothetical protein